MEAQLYDYYNKLRVGGIITDQGMDIEYPSQELYPSRIWVVDKMVRIDYKKHPEKEEIFCDDRILCILRNGGMYQISYVFSSREVVRITLYITGLDDLNRGMYKGLDIEMLDISESDDYRNILQSLNRSIGNWKIKYEVSEKKLEQLLPYFFDGQMAVIKKNEGNKIRKTMAIIPYTLPRVYIRYYKACRAFRRKSYFFDYENDAWDIRKYAIIGQYI